MALAGACEGGLPPVVVDQRREAVGQGAAGELHTPHCGGEVVVDRAPGHAAEVRESPHVAVQEGELVLALVEPDEVSPRVHQPHQEEPGPAPLATEFHRHLEEIHLRALARAVDQRHVDLGALAPPLAQVLKHQRQPDLVALLPQCSLQPPSRHALLRRGPLRPLLDQLLKPRSHPLQHRPRRAPGTGVAR